MFDLLVGHRSVGSPAHGRDPARGAGTTAPTAAREPTTEIQTSAAKATGVFMLLCVVMIT